jgi:uracil-DNA glycosylase
MSEELETLYKAYYDSKLHISSDECIIPLMGMINGTEILFVGQNPGAPFQKDHIKLFNEFTNLAYDEQQSAFKESWVKSMFVKFIINVCNKLDIDFHKSGGVTNIVKHWTTNNKRPIVTSADQKLLACEIELTKPKCVVFLSKFAYRQFAYKDKVTSACISLDHPAAHRYAHAYVDDVIYAIKGYL